MQAEDFQDLIFFRVNDFLIFIDADVTGEIVGDPAAEKHIRGQVPAEDFAAHDRAGDGGIGGRAEDRGETQSAQQRHGGPQQGRKKTAQGRSDKDQRYKLPALITRADGQSGEKNLKHGIKPMRPRRKGFLNIGNAQTHIIVRAFHPIKKNQQNPGHKGSKHRCFQIFLLQLFDDVGELDKNIGRHPEGHAGHRGDAEGPRTENNLAHGIEVRVRRPQKNASIVSDKRGDKTFQQSEESKLSDLNDLQTENRSRPGGSDSGAETRAGAGDQQNFSFLGIDAKKTGELIGQGRAHLHRSPLAPRRTAEQMRDHSSEQNKGRHSQRNDVARVVNFFQDKTRAAFRALSVFLIAKADEKSGQGQEPDDPHIVIAVIGGPIQRNQKNRGGDAREDADDQTVKGPL